MIGEISVTKGRENSANLYRISVSTTMNLPIDVNEYSFNLMFSFIASVNITTWEAFKEFLSGKTGLTVDGFGTASGYSRGYCRVCYIQAHANSTFNLSAVTGGTNISPLLESRLVNYNDCILRSDPV